MVELSTPNRKVAGSIPVGLNSTYFFAISNKIYFFKPILKVFDIINDCYKLNFRIIVGAFVFDINIPP